MLRLRGQWRPAGRLGTLLQRGEPLLQHGDDGLALPVPALVLQEHLHAGGVCAPYGGRRAVAGSLGHTASRERFGLLGAGTA